MVDINPAISIITFHVSGLNNHPPKKIKQRLSKRIKKPTTTDYILSTEKIKQFFKDSGKLKQRMQKDTPC